MSVNQILDELDLLISAFRSSERRALRLRTMILDREFYPRDGAPPRMPTLRAATSAAVRSDEDRPPSWRESSAESGSPTSVNFIPFTMRPLLFLLIPPPFPLPFLLPSVREISQIICRLDLLPRRGLAAPLLWCTVLPASVCSYLCGCVVLKMFIYCRLATGVDNPVFESF